MKVITLNNVDCVPSSCLDSFHNCSQSSQLTNKAFYPPFIYLKSAKKHTRTTRQIYSKLYNNKGTTMTTLYSTIIVVEFD